MEAWHTYPQVDLPLEKLGRVGLGVSHRDPHDAGLSLTLGYVNNIEWNLLTLQNKHDPLLLVLDLEKALRIGSIRLLLSQMTWVEGQYGGSI